MADDEKTFTFDELSPEAKERACDEHRYWNVDDSTWLDMPYYEDWLKELCAKRGVQLDVTDSMAIREEYNRWWVEINTTLGVLPIEVDNWILATPLPKAFGSINNYKLFIEDLESLLEKKEKLYGYAAQVESQRQTMLSFLKTELEGVEISLRMDFEDGHYATHRRSSTWAVDSIIIERTIDGVEYVYEQEDVAVYGREYEPVSDYLTVGGEEYGFGEYADEKAQSACDNVIKPIYDAATLALAPIFKEWFDGILDYLAKSAEDYYEYLISDEGVGESLEAHEVEFDKDGNRI